MYDSTKRLFYYRFWINTRAWQSFFSALSPPGYWVQIVHPDFNKGIWSYLLNELFDTLTLNNPALSRTTLVQHNFILINLKPNCNRIHESSSTCLCSFSLEYLHEHTTRFQSSSMPRGCNNGHPSNDWFKKTLRCTIKLICLKNMKTDKAQWSEY
jgi:hypothetical protein